MAEKEVRKCFNRSCSGEVECTRLWNGWRLSTGEYSSLCDSCVSLYEAGRFCDVYHSQAPGWVPCESCNKRIHCGCIVSSQTVTLLDAGGIQCITCAKTSGRLVLPINLTYSTTPYGTPFSERIKDISTKSWSQFPTVGPTQLHETPNSYNLAHYEARMRMPHEVGISYGRKRYNSGNGFTLGCLEKRSQQEFHWPVTSIARTSSIHVKRSPGNASNSEMEASGRLLRNAQLSQTPNKVESSIEMPIQNVRQGDGYGKNQLLTRYLPRTTDEELQNCAESSEITHLFEKTLSASDVGRIGRLVIPKKCAEAYFPHISHPEGLPLRVQDDKGKEWVFQFRFWPNNNSRMYVLEGVSAYIQAMQLLAGDKVTFSRFDPEGTLVMGFRKASNGWTDHEQEANKTSSTGDANPGTNLNLFKADKSCYGEMDITNGKSYIYGKRKGGLLSFKDRHLLFENMDVYELKITLEEAQRLIRPSPNDLSHVVIVANEIEEYEDCPVIGRPTIFTTDQMGQSIQWTQCEDCLKWRKLPADALLPVKWTCSNNIWDSERSTCTSPQDISAEQLDDLLFSRNQSPSKKVKTNKVDVATDDALEGLDSLANQAILGECQSTASPGHITTKHPRHKIGCSCIVCIQPPSGKSHKHKHTCECTVCLTVKRRFKTLMLRREKKQQEMNQESASEKHKENQLVLEKSQENELLAGEDLDTASTLKEVSFEGSVDISRVKNSSGSFLKGQIDLNIKPERDDSMISSELNTLGPSSPIVAEGENKMKAPTDMTVMEAMEVADDQTQTQELIETIVNGIATKQLKDDVPPTEVQVQLENETTTAATSSC